VDAIHYDYTRDSAFTIDVSINRDIVLPQGTQMALVSDGLLSGMAIELQLPEQSTITNDQLPIAKGSFIPTIYVPGLMESVQGELIAHVDAAIQSVDSLVASLQLQVQGDHLKNTLSNVDRVTSDLTGVSADLKRVVNTQVPTIVNNADKASANPTDITSDLQKADPTATVARVDTAVDGINTFIADVRSQEGTLGQLIYNKSLYDHIDATVVSADSLLVDLKAHPKRYVQVSVFGKKDK
jgi:phospholipid/cholesterol/gamma-HCH transport system substrate-binding protein